MIWNGVLLWNPQMSASANMAFIVLPILLHYLAAPTISFYFFCKCCSVLFRRREWLAYIICSITLGISSFFLICRVSAAATTTGSGLHMDVMLAVILGGMSIRGGPKSNIHAPIIGSLITYILTNGFTLCGVSVYWVQFLKGIIFLAVIILVFERKHRGALPS